MESVWALLKRSLANLVKHTLGELTVMVKSRLRHMQYRPALLESFLSRADSGSRPSYAPATEDR